MSREWAVKVIHDRIWRVGTLGPEGLGDVTIPLDQIEGMSDEEIGWMVRQLAKQAGLAVAKEVADLINGRTRVRASDENFAEHHSILLRYEEKDNLIDHALFRIDEAIAIEAKRRAAEEAKAQPGFVYVIKSGPYYKIGMTKHLDKRIQTLAIQLPERLTVVFTVPVQDMRRHEQRLHEWFKAKRLNGEWFALTQDDINAIGEMYSSR